MTGSGSIRRVGTATSLIFETKALQKGTIGAVSSVGRAPAKSLQSARFPTPGSARQSACAMGFPTPEARRLGGMSTPLSQLRDSYRGQLRRMDRAQNTIDRWMAQVDLFVAWARDTPLHEIKARDIELGFLAELSAAFEERNGRPMAATSMRITIQALKSFYRFLDDFDYLEDPNGGYLRNPMTKIYPPPVKQKPINWLQEEDDQRLLAAGPKQGKSPNTLRDRTVLYLYRFTGVRLDEGLSLTMRSVDIESETIRVMRSKTDSGLDREIPIAPELLPVLQRWIEFTKQKGVYRPDGPFLVTRNGTEMKPQQIQAMVARMAGRAGLDQRVTPHTLRRTFGSWLINRGVALNVVSKLLGHSSTVVTEKAYAVLLNNTIRREMMLALR